MQAPNRWCFSVPEGAFRSSGKPGTADEVANVAEFLMSPDGSFITGSDFLIDGGATASFFYDSLKPEN